MTKKEVIEKLTKIKGIGKAKAEVLYKNGFDSLEKFKKDFFKHMDNDFNTPLAFAVLFDLVNYCFKENVGGKKVIDFLLEIDKIFNILKKEKEKIPKEIQTLVKEREKARKEKNYDLSDKIREKIKKKGYYVDDTEKGSVIKKL